jgi:hypothetical protein
MPLRPCALSRKGRSRPAVAVQLLDLHQKGILHLVIDPADFALLKGKNALTAYTFKTGVAQHTFCSHCGMHAFYIPRSQPHKITVNARCLDGIDGPSLTPTRFFGGRDWEQAQAQRLADEGLEPPDTMGGRAGAITLQAILDRAPE